MLPMIVALLGVLVLGLALFSCWFERTPLPASLVALGAGILVGPAGFGWIDLDALGGRSHIVEPAARLTLGIGLVSVALRIPSWFPRRNWHEMFHLVLGGMLLMWVTASLLTWLILSPPFWLAALIGAIIAPTDPVAATPIVTGPAAEANLPARIRHAISFESGANDGLSYLLVFLPLLILMGKGDTVLSHWLGRTLIWEVVVATFLGVALGWAAGKLLRASTARNWMQEDWRLVYTVALALLAVGAGKLIHSDEVLVVFAAGAAFVQVVHSDERGYEEKGQEAVNRFFSVPIFALLGTAIPWVGWYSLGWRGVLLALAVLAFRRPVAVFLLRPLLPSLRSGADALFVAWFGPVAVAAIYYAALAENRLGDERIWNVVTLVICASVVLHGLTAIPFTHLYGSKTRRATA